MFSSFKLILDDEILKSLIFIQVTLLENAFNNEISTSYR